MLRATWYEGTAQLLSLTELKSDLFELYLLAIPLTNEGGEETGVPGENPQRRASELVSILLLPGGPRARSNMITKKHDFLSKYLPLTLGLIAYWRQKQETHTRGVTVSTPASLACHQYNCAGSSLAWGLNLRAVVFGIF